MTAEGRRGGPTRQRPLVVLGIALVMAILLFLFVESAGAGSADAERHRRAQEIEAREPELYRQLADQAGVLESQRQIYIERFRRLEVRYHPALRNPAFAGGLEHQLEQVQDLDVLNPARHLLKQQIMPHAVEDASKVRTSPSCAPS